MRTRKYFLIATVDFCYGSAFGPFYKLCESESSARRVIQEYASEKDGLTAKDLKARMKKTADPAHKNSLIYELEYLGTKTVFQMTELHALRDDSLCLWSEVSMIDRQLTVDVCHIGSEAECDDMAIERSAEHYRSKSMGDILSELELWESRSVFDLLHTELGDVADCDVV